MAGFSIVAHLLRLPLVVLAELVDHLDLQSARHLEDSSYPAVRELAIKRVWRSVGVNTGALACASCHYEVSFDFFDWLVRQNKPPPAPIRVFYMGFYEEFYKDRRLSCHGVERWHKYLERHAPGVRMCFGIHCPDRFMAFRIPIYPLVKLLVVDTVFFNSAFSHRSFPNVTRMHSKRDLWWLWNRGSMNKLPPTLTLLELESTGLGFMLAGGYDLVLDLSYLTRIHDLSLIFREWPRMEPLPSTTILPDALRRLRVASRRLDEIIGGVRLPRSLEELVVDDHSSGMVPEIWDMELPLSLRRFELRTGVAVPPAGYRLPPGLQTLVVYADIIAFVWDVPPRVTVFGPSIEYPDIEYPRNMTKQNGGSLTACGCSGW